MNRRAVYLGLVLLVALHQDFWLWDDPTLVWGFLPAGLAYHVVYSCLTALYWALALRFAWPQDAEAFAEAGRERRPR